MEDNLQQNEKKVISNEMALVERNPNTSEQSISSRIKAKPI